MGQSDTLIGLLALIRMPSNRKFYRRVVRFEILSEEPIKDCLTLEEIAYEVTDGHWSGAFLSDEAAETVNGVRMAELLQGQGSDPEFFQLNEQGDDVE